MKKLHKLFLEIYYALHLAHKWHCGLCKVLQFVCAGDVVHKQISKSLALVEDSAKRG